MSFFARVFRILLRWCFVCLVLFFVRVFRVFRGSVSFVVFRVAWWFQFLPHKIYATRTNTNEIQLRNTRNTRNKATKHLKTRKYRSSPILTVGRNLRHDGQGNLKKIFTDRREYIDQDNFFVEHGRPVTVMWRKMQNIARGHDDG